MGSEDQVVVNNIRQGDKIKSVTLEGDTSVLLEGTSEQVKYWNTVMG
jgi:hypothetical protein